MKIKLSSVNRHMEAWGCFILIYASKAKKVQKLVWYTNGQTGWQSVNLLSSPVSLVGANNITIAIEKIKLNIMAP